MSFLSSQSCPTTTPTFAGASVSDGPGHVPVKALLAVVAVAACRVVAAVHADASALPPRQLVQLHVESAASRVEVAVARCRGKRVRAVSCVNAFADYQKKRVKLFFFFSENCLQSKYQTVRYRQIYYIVYILRELGEIFQWGSGEWFIIYAVALGLAAFPELINQRWYLQGSFSPFHN